MSPGATYSPGAWFALVSPTIAVLIEPDLPGQRLDELWRTIQAEQGGEAALEVIRAAGMGGRPPIFALAALEDGGVRLVMRGSMQVTVQDEAGRERVLRGSSSPTIWQEQIPLTEVLWLVRPGGRADGVALPIVCGAVMADVLAWQPIVETPELRQKPASPAAELVPSESVPSESVPSESVPSESDEQSGDVPASRVEPALAVSTDSDDSGDSDDSVQAGTTPDPAQDESVVEETSEADGALAADEPSTRDVAAVEGPDSGPDSEQHIIDLTVPEPTPKPTSESTVRGDFASTELAPPTEAVPPARPIGRASRRQTQASSRPIRLGSHARRRYGADDWSLAGTDRRPDRGQLKPEPAIPAEPATPGTSLPTPVATSAHPAAPMTAADSDAAQEARSLFEPVITPTPLPVEAPPVDLFHDAWQATPGEEAPPETVDVTMLADSKFNDDASSALDEVQAAPELPELPVRVRGAGVPIPIDPAAVATDDRPVSWMEESGTRDEYPESDVEADESTWDRDQAEVPVLAGSSSLANVPLDDEYSDVLDGATAGQLIESGQVSVSSTRRRPLDNVATGFEQEQVSDEAVPLYGVMAMPGGHFVDVDGPVIIGRAPSQVDDDRPARLITVNSAGRAISRNHVRLDVGMTGLFVVDLGSRNGTRLHRPGESGIQLEPWLPYPIPLGSVLVVADVMMTFVRDAAAAEALEVAED